MLGWLLEGQPEPEHVPDDAGTPVGVERGIPVDILHQVPEDYNDNNNNNNNDNNNKNENNNYNNNNYYLNNKNNDSNTYPLIGIPRTAPP